MKKWPTYPRVLAHLAATATTLPIFGGYFVSFQMLLWLVLTGRWGTAKRRAVRSVSDTVDHATLERARFVLRPIHWGVAAFLAATIVASLVAWGISPFAAPFKAVMKQNVHFAVKLGLLWYVLAGALTWLWRRGWSPARVAPWFAAWLGANLVYCLVQRQTGIDWTHGFGAVLGPHRFAYGVYRVSGFMGHPLTLAYNLVLVALAASALLWRQPQALTPGLRRAWWAVLVFAVATLLVSGSRFPLVVLAGVWLCCERQRLWRLRRWLALAVVVLAAGLWLEGSMLGRVKELLDPAIPLTERFDRLVFWRVHWAMFLDHPVAGVGLAGLDDAYQRYYSGIVTHDKLYTAHNVFLQTLADSGLIGLSGLLALLFGLGTAARRLGKSRGLVYLVAGLIASGLMQNNLRDSEFLFALWFLVALAALSGTVDERESTQNLEPAAHRAHSAPHLPG